MPLVERMTIAGVGLIGGSLAAAARNAGLVGEVLGFGRTAANLAVARERGLVDRIVTDDAAAADADLIVLATPVETCAPLAERFRRHARPTTVVTDVGSVKGTLVAALERAWGDGAGGVVGAHPIAGSEASGAAAAQPDLFRERLCILTPTARTPAPALRLVRSLWEGVGARVEEMSPETHDAILARVSHLPHVLAYALVRAVADRQADGRRLLDYVGTGFLDATRIAASPAEVWRDIVLANRPALTAALAEMRLALDELVTLINAGDGRALEEALATAADVRRGLGAKG
jgi:prephenate dehydrogenase